MQIDIHTHAFPDALATRALRAVTAETPQIPPQGDGRVSGLLASMDEAGIDMSVVVSIATKPAQVRPILEWSQQVADERLKLFPSVHPAASDAVQWVDEIAASGFAGIKLHPYYQRIDLEDPGVTSVCRRAAEHDLIVLVHAGYDIAFPRDRLCDPARFAALLDRVPGLKMIAAHLGGWEDWDDVRRHLLGRPVYLDTAFVYDYLGAEAMSAFLREHPRDYLLFGSDWPWDSQAKALTQIRDLHLGASLEAALLGGNARRLLQLQPVKAPG